MEHIDIKGAFLHDIYGYHNPVYIKEMARVDGSYKHGGTINILQRNLYGNLSSKYYYIEGLMLFLSPIQYKLTEAELCLVRIEMKSCTIVAMIGIYDFLITVETQRAMGQFYDALQAKYEVKRMGTATRYIGWH